MEDAREARRKKLVNRGGDRLAFITGQARSLREPDNPLPQPPAGDSQPTKDGAGSDAAKSQASGQTSRLQTEMDNEIFNYEISNGPVKQETNKQSGEVSATTSDRASYRAMGNAPKTSRFPFTPGQISATISATENIRLICSVVVGLWVVLSHYGYSLGLGGVISFRPLLLVLLTDVTVILGRLVLDEAARNTVKGGTGWMANIGGMLEAAMLLHKALGAVFMDCSICAVIMICGIVS